MRLVIDAADFRKLSAATQRELIERFAGDGFARRTARRRSPEPATRRSRVDPRQAIDLTPELARQLMHSLADNHRRRLAQFARRGGRVTMRQLLRATGDSDPRVLSYFQSVVTRKLRRILGDEHRQALLIQWDYESTRWNRERTQIVDGVYYVTPATTDALRDHFGIA